MKYLGIGVLGLFSSIAIFNTEKSSHSWRTLPETHFSLQINHFHGKKENHTILGAYRRENTLIKTKVIKGEGKGSPKIITVTESIRCSAEWC